jgi:hypothetical protein
MTKVEENIINPLFCIVRVRPTEAFNLIASLKTDAVVISDKRNVQSYLDITKLQEVLKAKNIPLVINSDYEVNIYNNNFRISDDKELMAFSGILGSLKGTDRSSDPFIPKVAVFVLYTYNLRK